MTDPIHITVPYKGIDKEFEIHLLLTGYTHRIQVLVNNIPVLFEPDEERQYRAVVPAEYRETGQSLDPSLLQAIAETLARELS